MFDQNNGVRFVTGRRLAELSGYGQPAIATKSEDGTWVEGREWKWGPDGRKLYDIEGYNAWCLRDGRPSTRGRKRAES